MSIMGVSLTMNSYAFIPVISLSGYTFLLLAFLAAKKTKVIKSFMFMLVSGVLWTGGSFFMRMLLWPGVKVWFDISITGLLLLTYSFMLFVRDFTGAKPVFIDKIWALLIVIVGTINIFTGVFVHMPDVVTDAAGNTGFVYNIKWPIIFMVLLCGCLVAQMFYLIVKCFRSDAVRRRQFTSVAFGIAAIFIGHLLYLLPIFKGIPMDILSGLVMVICLFYSLYRRRLFKLTLLVSKGSSYAIVAVLSLLIFSNFVKPLDQFLETNFTALAEQKMLIISLLFTALTIIIYYLMKKFIDGIFIRDEIARADNLKAFGSTVSKTLDIKNIMEEMVSVVKNTIPVKNIYICIENKIDKTYNLAHAVNPLDNLSVSLSAENPVIRSLKERNECLFIEDLKRLADFKSMWEEEKRMIIDYEIECFVPLKYDDILVGVMLLTSKEKGNRYTFDDISFLESVSAIGSIAVKNSSLYEKAVQEARTDELTELLNRKCFYEVLETEYEKNRNKSLALMILNIDDFKLYNQLYGNAEGDIALKRIANIIKASVGASGHVARYGAKEFAVILPGFDLLGSKNLASVIRKQILNINKSAPDYSMKVLTISVGISAIPYAATSLKELVDSADMAVFQVKRSGKNAIALSSGGGERSNPTDLAAEVHKKDIYSGYASTIYALAAAIDAKDHYTFSHSKNVEYYASELGYACGLNDDSVEIIREAALLHDIGKIGISELILNKPGRLSQDEFEIMKSHVENSVGIIRHLPSLDYVIPAVIGHHERYDGTGYPRRISGEDIPLSARILCIADSFDAMISRRPYKDQYTVFYAKQELQRQAGRQFDHRLVGIFLELLDKGIIVPRERDSQEFGT